MINYTCDVCGSQMPQDYKRTKPETCHRIVGMTKVEDVCEKCLKAGEKLDASTIVLAAWRTALEQNCEKEATKAGEEKTAKKPKTTITVDKAAVRDRLENFKKVRGLSSMPDLEKAIKRKGITVPVLLSASVGAETLTPDVWAAIDRGLDKLNAPEAGHGENN